MTVLPHRLSMRTFPWRRACGLVLSGIVLGGVLAAVGWQGLLRPMRVAEASMEPAFCGDQWLLDCPHCGVRFALDATLPPRLDQVVCVRCRHPFDATARAVFRPGQRVVIARFRRWGSGPRRWEVWALRDPREGQRLVIKRVVALPGEQVSLRSGDVYVDGRLVQKSLAELHSLAIPVTAPLVHPAGTTPATGRDGWAAETADSRWQQTRDGLVFDAARQVSGATVSSARCDWLKYDPLAAVTGVPLPSDAAGRARLARQFLPVPDMLLRCQLSAAPNAQLALRLESSDDTWVLTWRIDERRLELRRDQTLVVQQPIDAHSATGEWQIEFGRCDRQILFGLSGQQMLACGFAESDRAVGAEPPWTRLSLGASAGRVTVRTLQLWRDVHYEQRRGPRAWPLPAVLAADQYFLLGDNSAASVDSRDAAMGPVSRRQLLGVVRPWPWSAAAR